jgi:hypothetical protein
MRERLDIARDVGSIRTCCDRNPESSIWNEPEGNGGTTLTAQLPAIRAFLAYINFHTVQFAGGEIRGQIVPESSAIVLTGVGGLILLGAACCRSAARRV